MPGENDLELVSRVVALLSAQGVDTWIFGGWAEQIHGLSPARARRDIDLLYLAADFGRLDVLLRCGEWHEIVGKRFPHKRAFTFEGVTVELFLVQQDDAGMHTDFWGAVRHDWPDDSFSTLFGLPVASERALVGFRADHDRVHQPRADWLAKARRA